MKDLKAVLAKTFKTNSYLLSKAIEDMSDEHIKKRPNDKTNPIQYLIGHITIYRFHTCKLLGHEQEYSYTDLFKMGTFPADPSTYPSVKDLMTEWNEISEKMFKLLENTTEEKLTEAFENKYPIGEQNLGGALSFLTFHESYHIGQISYIRKFMGYETLIG